MTHDQSDIVVGLILCERVFVYLITNLTEKSHIPIIVKMLNTVPDNWPGR